MSVGIVPATSKPAAVLGGARAWYTLGVLILAYVFAYIDRTLLTLQVGPIRQTLRITDLQLSLLSGFAFALFYSVLGIPIGRLVDRVSRRRVIAGGIALWSVMTALCGLAGSFTQLFCARVGVGVGEAALSPGAYSLLSDSFSARLLPRALSAYSAAIYVGSGLALIGGGALAQMAPSLRLPGVGVLVPWQVLFVLVGLPGLTVAALMATVTEPARRGTSLALGDAATLPQAAAFLWARGRAYGGLIGGYAVASLLWNGTMAWLPTLFLRNRHWSLPHVGLVLGTALILCGTAGITLGGAWATQRRAAGDVTAGLKIGMLSAALVLPCGVLAALLPGDSLPAIFVALFFLFGSAPYGAAAAALQEVTPNQLRGQVSALYLFGLNLAGIGMGPTCVAFLASRVFGGDLSLGAALALTTVIAAPLSVLLLAFSLPAWRAAATARDF